ncbi:hypothetical protein FQN50_000591 [Emmonsiellopsis sp. PD_5]|nr:hypothetical protein FQN50_000591 [Emmonsiellopsis sp. PD_5]
MRPIHALAALAIGFAATASAAPANVANVGENNAVAELTVPGNTVAVGDVVKRLGKRFRYWYWIAPADEAEPVAEPEPEPIAEPEPEPEAVGRK